MHLRPHRLHSWLHPLLPQGPGIVRLVLRSGLFLLRPRGRLVRRSTRYLERDRHAAVDRERMALGFGLRMQGRRVARTARNAVNDLGLRSRRLRDLCFGGRRRHRLGLLGAQDRTSPPNRRAGDEQAKSILKVGMNHATSLNRTGRNSEPGTYLNPGRKNSEKLAARFRSGDNMLATEGWSLPQSRTPGIPVIAEISFDRPRWRRRVYLPNLALCAFGNHRDTRLPPSLTEFEDP